MIGLVLRFLALAVPSTLVGAWGTMLSVGIAHHEWTAAIPTISYEAALLVNIPLCAASLIVILFRWALR